MDEFTPSIDQLIKERLIYIADLLGLNWDEYNCDLYFTLKDDDISNLDYLNISK